MRRAELASNACLPVRNNGKPESRYKDAFLQQHVTHLDGGGGFAHNNRDDGRFSGQRLEPGFGYLLAEVVCVFAKYPDPVGMRIEKLDRCKRIGKELRTRSLSEHVAQRRGSCHETTCSAAERLAECRCDHVDFADYTVMLRGATTVLAEHSGCVRVVHHDNRIVFARDLED